MIPLLGVSDDEVAVVGLEKIAKSNCGKASGMDINIQIPVSFALLAIMYDERVRLD